MLLLIHMTRWASLIAHWFSLSDPKKNCVTTVYFGMLRPLAHGTRLATDYAEATKRRAKAAACDANNFDFMT